MKLLLSIGFFWVIGFPICAANWDWPEKTFGIYFLGLLILALIGFNL